MDANEVPSERERFERLYRSQGSRLRNFFRFSLGNSQLAEDLTQETFLDVWARGLVCDPERGGVGAYLLGMARKKAADWRRRNRSSGPAAGGEALASATDNLAIRNAVDQLPPDLRSLLWLREVEGYSYEELKNIFRIPIGTVRSRLHAARRLLREVWTKEAQ